MVKRPETVNKLPSNQTNDRGAAANKPINESNSSRKPITPPAKPPKKGK